MNTVKPTHRPATSLVVLVLMAGMVALGLWSSQPPPPRSPEDPQPLLQIYRHEVPKDLLLALPLRLGDHWRFNALAPSGLFHTACWLEPSGETREFGPIQRRQAGHVDELVYPLVNTLELTPAVGTKVVVLAARRQAPPTTDQITAAFGTEPWPRLPEYCMVRFSLRGVEVTGPKGPRLPTPEVTAAVETRIQAALRQLATTCDFVLGVAVPLTAASP